jgi:hypothetical protein
MKLARSADRPAGTGGAAVLRTETGAGAGTEITAAGGVGAGGGLRDAMKLSSSADRPAGSGGEAPFFTGAGAGAGAAVGSCTPELAIGSSRLPLRVPAAGVATVAVAVAAPAVDAAGSVVSKRPAARVAAPTRI